MESKQRLYRLYEDIYGRPRTHWQYRGTRRVPRVHRQHGRLVRPQPDWIVRAKSAKQAHYFVWNRVHAEGRRDGLGIVRQGGH